MRLRNRIYSLRNVGDKVVLSLDLTNKIISEDTAYIVVDLPTGTSYIKKSDYLNTIKVYTVDEKLFFLICTKSVSQDYIFEVLMRHAIGKIDHRIEKLQDLKTNYASKLKVA